MNVRDVIDETINSNKLTASKKRQQLGLHLCNSIPKFLKSDAGRIQQVINNLVGNAIKFNPDGAQITVECYYQDED